MKRLPWNITAVLLFGMAPAGHAAPLWKCVDSSGTSHYVQKKLPSARCGVVQPAPAPPSRPYLPSVSPMVLAPAPGASFAERPPLPLIDTPGTPPKALPPLPGDSTPMLLPALPLNNSPAK